MQIINHIKNNFNNYRQLNDQFVGTPPYPMITLDNFLPLDIVRDMQKECESIPDSYWTSFDRKGSYMKECVNLEVAPIAANVVNQLHSQAGMNWLTQITGIKDLIPDPYIVGAGYSKSYKGDSLKIHTDFNWNDKIKMHRMLSFIIYLTEDWKDEYEGHLHFYDFNNKNLIQKVAPNFNRAVFWRHHKRGFHGHPNELTCPAGMSRNAFRLFFYVSNAEHDANDRPHRSLYWYDPELNEPYDIPTRK